MSAGFPDTHWSRLVALRERTPVERDEILAWFARQYWRPIYQYVRALRRCTPDEALDVTQQFFLKLLGGDGLDGLSKERGSLRGFLKVSLRNFLISADRSARAQPRLLPLDLVRDDLADEQSASPEEAFDRAWSREVLTRAVAQLRSTLQAEGRHQQFEMFEAYSLGEDDIRYEDLAARFAMKPEDVRNRVRDARRRLLEIVRDSVAEYAGPGLDVEQEIAFLLRTPVKR